MATHTLRNLATGLVAAAVICVPIFAEDPPKPAEDPPRYAGAMKDGGTLLANGWTITPAGLQVELKDLPLNILTTPDNRFALVATSGFNAHELSVVDLAAKTVGSRETVRQSWFGLAHDAASGRIWWSGGGAKALHTFDLKDGKLTRTGAPEAVAKKGAAKARNAPKGFRTGLTYDAKANLLYTLDTETATLAATDPATGKVSKSGTVGVRPYDVAVARNGSRLYVSDWAGRSVLAVSPDDLRVVAKISVGDHPSQLALHPKDDRLFVANASSNSVSVIDTKRGVVTETIMTGLFPLAPEGSTPTALAVSPDGETLYVANSDNNCVAVVDVEAPSRSQVKGFIPTGWYPTSVAMTPDGKNLLVGVGWGNQPRANPPSEDHRKKVEELIKGTKGELSKEVQAKLRKFPYIGTTLSGALSIVPVPDDKALAAYTATVYKNCPYSDKLLTDAPSTRKTAIPTKVGDKSPIKHVIYIIKENRTYDQVFSDIPRGNRDESLLLFGRPISPNHHKLAEDFVLLDNLYCNGHVSADGHPWSTMAYNTDYIAKNWALTYSGREGVDLDDDAELEKAPSGYIWDLCARHNLTYRSYGEYGRRVSQPDGSVRMEARAPGLVGHICPDFGVPKVPGQRVRDTENVETFLEEFREFEKAGNLPNFIVMSLGEDHTTGTALGTFTPQACVASNDLALGRLVEAVTKSKYWPETAIFVIEDDAQNGPDHVDAHRTIGLVISPYTRRKHLDSTQYSTVSMMRTMELILGLPPLSQFDAGATPMFGSFTDTPDLAPYTHLPAQIDVNAKNTALAYGAERSSKMDFSEYDKINDFELNEILWRAIKGPDAPLPPAVRRAIAYRTAIRP